jgi:signal transduction histidine kinase
MKNFLGIIIGFSDLLLGEMPADDPRRADLNEIRKAGEGALALMEKGSAAAPGEDLK